MQVLCTICCSSHVELTCPLVCGKSHPTEECNVRVLLHRLWADHVIYTRLYLISRAKKNSVSAGSYATRLMKNQEDIGNAVGTIFGTKIGDELIRLLKEHIGGAVAIVDAVLAKTPTEAVISAWYKNGNDIAVFLHTSNQKYNLVVAKTMMTQHLAKTLNEATLLLSDKESSTKDIANFDAIMDDIGMMADFLWKGI